MLSVGKVVIFSRFVHYLTNKYGSYSKNILRRNLFCQNPFKALVAWSLKKTIMASPSWHEEPVRPTLLFNNPFSLHITDEGWVEDWLRIRVEINHIRSLNFLKRLYLNYFFLFFFIDNDLDRVLNRIWPACKKTVSQSFLTGSTAVVKDFRILYWTR